MIIALSDTRGGLFGYSSRLQEAFPSECALQFVDRTSKISGAEVFLQFSGYGFAKKGAPLWLLRTLRRDRSKYRTLGIFFHELYAVKPPWKSAFWMSPIQKYIARELVEISDFWMTSCTRYADWISEGPVKRPGMVLPVFSNVGEPRLSNHPRLGQAIVFGSESVRIQTYRAAGRALVDWTRREGLELVDIGDEIHDADVSRLLRDARATICGRLPEYRVSEMLSQGKFGLLQYDSARLAKSGVFAAYSSHGLAPVVFPGNVDSEDGLVGGIHYFSGIPKQSSAQDSISRISRNAYSWYGGHSIAHHVEQVRNLFSAAIGVKS